MKIIAHRIGDGPIIRPHMDERMGENVNGPSLIKVPDWVTRPLGRYYLYFAHHDGRYIRLAFADEIAGPWRTHEAGVLPIEDSLFEGHIASPDVIVDGETKSIRLYYHGADVPTGRRAPQVTRLAMSEDGLNFKARPETLGRPYMRVIRCRGWYYAIAMPGSFYRSRNGLTNFEEGPNPFEPNMRHAALLIRGDTLVVFYTRIGDAPEHIVATKIDLTQDWYEWRPTTPVSVLKPERSYEGGDLERLPSVRGQAHGRVCQLRDPAVFEGDEKIFLLYSVAGENGIAVAHLDLE